MSATSKKNAASRKQPGRKSIARPFDPELLKRAREIVERYEVVVWFEDGEWYGRGVELPHVMNDGKTPEECVANTRDILTSTVAYLLETGEVPPAAAREGIRTEQVNVRLTAEEKLQLESAAQRKGFRGLSDFMRSAALAGAS
jgi:predicted RNase H-like HicB family nuclease